MPKSEKIALVTGANKGIGFEVARQLAAKGFRVFVGARNEKAGRAAAQKIEPAATFLKIDVSDPASIREAAAELPKMVDHLDVLVSNAGIIRHGDDAILKATPDQFETTMRTNTLGPNCRASLSAHAREVIGTPDRQCFKQRRTTARRRRWLVASLLHFKNGVEWSNFAARHCTAEICREFSLSRLGPHLYGWGQCDSLGRTRRGRNCLARGRGTAKSHRQIFAGSQTDSVVTTLVPSRSNEH